MNNYLDVANSPVMWLASVPIVIVVLIQAILYTKKAFLAASKIGIPKSDCIKAFRTGMISAIGPAVSIFIVMIGLMAAVGSPVAWMRLSIMGSAAAEMLNAGFGAQALGITMGTAEYDLRAYTASVWGMSLFTFGLLPIFFFTHRMEKVKNKITNNNSDILILISTACMLGIMTYMTASNAMKNTGMFAAALGSVIATYILILLSKKYKWINEYQLGIAMIVGLICASIFSGVTL